MYQIIIALELWLILVILAEAITRKPKVKQNRVRRMNGQFARKVKIGGMNEGALYL